MKKIINTSNAPKAIGPYSQAVWAGDLLFLSGQIALCPETGAFLNSSLEEESHQVMKNIKSILNAAEMDYQNIIKSSIFLKDMNDFAEVNQIYASYLSEPFPARETVEVARLPKDARIEISIIAKK
jgi:2-iminobutanoate/2-iminopropanoate deaminase